MKKFGHAIFDMDGTMMDSMPAWKNLGRDYLIGKGIKVPQNLNVITNDMSMTESANYFQKELGVNDNVQKIMSDINELIEDKYKYEMPLKPYVNEYLLKLKREGIIMCVVTATPLQLAEAALKRLKVLEYFTFVLCCDEVGVGKSEPDSYYFATKKMETELSDVMVYEDADYAMKTAKDAGFYTIGVYDKATGKSKNEMQLLCDRYIDSFECLL
ncbi:HAD family hydrolase [Clostridium sp.]|uniref:HAD family hydrolase n=1 Tax=Clostridium sp. TaxID=1506 RepID=UPI0026164088|nr:HAD family phosphatase [uncultured Clostridium sp.]